jgi:hypothetical protein
VQVDDPDDPRFAAALEVLRERGEMAFRDLGLSLSDRELVVRVASNWMEVDEPRARADIDRAKLNLEALRAASPAFEDAVRGRTVRLVLGHEGKDGWDVCEESDGVLRWL